MAKRKFNTGSKLSAKGIGVYQNISLKNIVEIDGSSVIKDVVIIQSGFDKVGDYFTKSFIEDIVAQGNEQSKNRGVKSRFGHPNMCKTSLGSALGRFKNFRMIEEDGLYKAVADLWFLETSKKTQVEGRGISLHDYTIELAKEDAEMFGNSIVYSYRWKQVSDEDRDQLPEDYEFEYYQKLETFIASDVVDSPAATTNLFKDTDDLGVQLFNFLEELPDDQFEVLTNALEQKPETVSNFITRLKATKSNKMSLLTKLKEALTGKKEEGAKDFTMTTASGDILTVVTDEDRTEPKVGDMVNDSEGAPVADGDHVMSDETVITTEGGKITAITPKQTAEEEEESGESEEIKSLKSFFEGKFKEMQSSIDKISKTVSDNMKETEAGLMHLAKHVKTDVQFDKGSRGSKDREEESTDRVVTKKESATR